MTDDTPAPVPQAPERFGPEEGVQWLIHIAALDPARLRPGDLLNLKAELIDYLGGAKQPDAERALRGVEQRPGRLTPVLRDLRQLLEGVADRRQVRLPFQAKYLVLDARDTSWLKFYLGTTLREMLLAFAVFDLIDLDDFTYVRRCKECRRVFYAARSDQLYCGRRCANAVAARAYRKDHAAERRQKAKASRAARKGEE